MATRKDTTLIENALRLAYERGEVGIPCPSNSAMISLRFRFYSHAKALRAESEMLGVKSDMLMITEAISLCINKATHVLTLQRKDKEEGMQALERRLDQLGKERVAPPAMPSAEAESLARVQALAAETEERTTPYYRREE